MCNFLETWEAINYMLIGFTFTLAITVSVALGLHIWRNRENLRRYFE